MGVKGFLFAAAGALALAAAYVAPAGAATSIQWCGTTADARDRADAVTGHQVHVAYAIPSDGSDRFSSVASAIASDFASIDLWWRRNDPSRTPRFDLAAFPGCTTELGTLDISSIRLPNPGSYYAANATRFDRLHADTFSATFGFTHPAKKYVVLYDAPVQDPPEWCGVAYSDPSRGGPFGAAFVLLQVPGCRTRLGEAGRGASTMVHEIIHTLGALPPVGPPNACPTDRGHPCDSEVDILRAGRAEDFLDNLTLDVGRNDYYAHSGSWWDIQDSPWLRRLDRAAVRFDVALRGSGRVSADLPGLDCAATCATTWEAGSRVTLTATPTSGWQFRGWEGACTGTGTCSVTLEAAANVAAVFWRPVRLNVSAAGGGVVASTPEGILCPPTCGQDFDTGSSVTLTAQPEDGFRFLGWGGDCSGLTATCTVTVDGARSVVATFGPAAYRLSASVRGQGRVVGGGLNCGTRCRVDARALSRVTLRAQPARGWRFVRWAGACRGTRASCAVTMSQPRQVTAIFTRRR